MIKKSYEAILQHIAGYPEVPFVLEFKAPMKALEFRDYFLEYVQELRAANKLKNYKGLLDVYVSWDKNMKIAVFNKRIPLTPLTAQEALSEEERIIYEAIERARRGSSR